MESTRLQNAKTNCKLHANVPFWRPQKVADCRSSLKVPRTICLGGHQSEDADCLLHNSSQSSHEASNFLSLPPQMQMCPGPVGDLRSKGRRLTSNKSDREWKVFSSSLCHQGSPNWIFCRHLDDEHLDKPIMAQSRLLSAEHFQRHFRFWKSFSLMHELGHLHFGTHSLIWRITFLSGWRKGHERVKAVTHTRARPARARTVCTWRRSTSGTCTCTAPRPSPCAWGSLARSTANHNHRWPWTSCCTRARACPVTPAWGQPRKSPGRTPCTPGPAPCAAWTAGWAAPAPCVRRDSRPSPPWPRRTSPSGCRPRGGRWAWPSSTCASRTTPRPRDTCTPPACGPRWPATQQQLVRFPFK